MEWVWWIAQSSGFQGMVSGTITAAIVDVGAFRGWKSWDDAVTYNWSLASFRWAQGAIIGALSGLGMSGFD
jgi:hypothetical protein